MKKVSHKQIISQKKEKKVIIKKGKRNGVQLYFDKSTNTSFLETYKDVGFPKETKEKAIALYLEGNSFRTIGRIIGCHHTTVINWVKEASEKLKDEPLFKSLPDDQVVIEMDELWHFCQKKAKRGGFGLQLIETRNKSSNSSLGPEE